MKFVIDNWMLITVALASGAMLLWPTLQATGGGLGTAMAVQMINREKAVVVDVSEPDQFAQGHVGGARNVPLANLEQQLPQAVKNKSLPVIFVCATGGSPSGRAVAAAKKLGYERVEALSGGLKAWKEANLPIEKA